MAVKTSFNGRRTYAVIKKNIYSYCSTILSSLEWQKHSNFVIQLIRYSHFFNLVFLLLLGATAISWEEVKSRYLVFPFFLLTSIRRCSQKLILLWVDIMKVSKCSPLEVLNYTEVSQIHYYFQGSVHSCMLFIRAFFFNFVANLSRLLMFCRRIVTTFLSMSLSPNIWA